MVRTTRAPSTTAAVVAASSGWPIPKGHPAATATDASFAVAAAAVTQPACLFLASLRRRGGAAG
eukprot:1700550-Prymnesium_polylepis.1